ncbi:MAG: T9SS type A sorting domain-containing protein [Ignavibacteriales bacterium]|nr:T9SS type A sorting domain-containing protein [Ignavibacteriales bacterium]
MGVTASAELFDSTIGRIDANFYNKTALLDIDVIPGSDSIDIKVLTTNLTGHKLPTGIPFRRMWIHLKVMNSNSEIIFESGKWGNDGEVIGHDTPFEPHYDIIRAQDQIQIYEGVFIDVNGQVTQTLLRAAEYVKDNRLPPAGFTTSHISYDSVKITGINGDENFNKLANVEGTGSDIVTYRIDPLTNGELTITAELCYQTMKPAAIQNLASVGSPESIKFLDMWENEDRSPSIITSKSETFVVTSTEGENEQAAKDEFIYIYPNPSKGDMTFSFQLKTSQNVEISIFNPLGEKVKNILSGTVDPGKQNLKIDTKSLSTGVYFLVMKTQSGVRSVKVVIVR